MRAITGLPSAELHHSYVSYGHAWAKRTRRADSQWHSVASTKKIAKN